MSKSTRNSFSLLILVAGLSLWTLAPYGGCSCQNPVDPSTSGPTPTLTPTLGPVVADFESSTAGNEYTNFGGLINVLANPNGTPASHNSTAAMNLTAGAPAGTPGKAMRFYGTMGQDGPPYPWVQMTLPFTQTMSATYVNAFTGLRFWVKRNNTPPVAAPHFRVNFTDGVITEGGAWYKYDFSIPALNTWTQISVSFPGGPAPVFAQPSWATQPKTWLAPNNVKYSLNAVVFQAFPSTTAAWNYDFEVDDVKFF